MFKSNKDVESVYNNDRYFAKITTSKGDFDESIEFVIDIYNSSAKITDSCCRKYHSSKELWFRNDKTEEGAVVEHQQFIINDLHRGKGHAGEIHKLEVAGYKGKYRQIQLKASEDGIFVWSYLGFTFRSEAILVHVRDIFLSFLAEVWCNNEPQKALVVFKKCDTFAKMKDYCKVKDRESFTDYIARVYGNLRFDMYKTIDGGMQ